MFELGSVASKIEFVVLNTVVAFVHFSPVHLWCFVLEKLVRVR